MLPPMAVNPEIEGNEPRDEGELVSVAYANDRVEAEMIQGLLKSSGIPSVLQHIGVDGPLVGIGLLNPGGGSRQVLVRISQAEEARALLAETLEEAEQENWAESANAAYLEEATGRKPRNYGLAGAYARIWAWSLGLMLLAFAVFLLLRLV
jgi:Putative prokaryotic signal transducing protein